MTAPERLGRLLGGQSLQNLRRRLRRRYELGRLNDVLSLTNVSQDERRALEGLLGRRPGNATSIQISIAEIDIALSRAGLASSLREALEQLDGPIFDLVAEREDLATRWQGTFAGHVTPTLSALVSEGSGQTLVKRLSRGDPDVGRRYLDATAAVIANLPAAGIPLSRVAARVLGDSHALDEGQPIATLVLAALRCESAERPREAWAKWGVLLGELAAPALVLSIPAAPGSLCGDLVNRALELGEPIHLSLRLLLRSSAQWAVSGRPVFICENPAVVAMAADALGAQCAPLICTDGMPSAAQRTLLMQVREAGAILRYHGDFDWPGIVIGNFVLRTFGAEPWRFGAEDYSRACSQHPSRGLAGTPVAANWDAQLSTEMAASGKAIHEEAVIDGLLEDLAHN